MSRLGSAAKRLQRLGDPLIDATAHPLTRGELLGLALLVLLPTVMNAIMLSTELTLPVPSLNDNELHYLFLQRASEALSNGQSVIDFWVPSIEAGFPQFLYYQHLPTLIILGVQRLSLGSLDLLNAFNLVRFLLLVGLPLSVYIAMRWFGFSVVVAALAAAVSTLLSGDTRYGFEYDSYIWRGFGMTTQLFAMHLSFLTVAASYRAIQKGKGLWIAAILFGLLVLTHLIYAYMTAMAFIVFVLWGLRRSNVMDRAARIAVVGGIAAVMSAYVWIPLLRGTAYMNATPYLQPEKYDSFGAGPILGWLVTGDLLDHGRLPVLTILLVVGIAAALVSRSRTALVALALFGMWLVAFFGRPTLGPLAELFPLAKSLLFHRFAGMVSLGAIILMGIGAAIVWSAFKPGKGHLRLAGAVLMIGLLLVPAVMERQTYYSYNTAWQARSAKALNNDADAQATLLKLRSLPPGRVFAGLPATYGNSEGMRFQDLHFYNLLAFYGIEGLARPIEALSLNSDYIWDFNDRDPSNFDLWNVKYMVAPSDYAVADFLVPIFKTSRYVIYQAPGGGYAEYAGIESRLAVSSQAELFASNVEWIRRPATGRPRTFIRYDYPSKFVGTGTSAAPACPDGGQIDYERFDRGQIDLVVACPAASTLILKTTYHPNWEVTVDGKVVHTFMVSPSYIGVSLESGKHQVDAVYHETPIKGPLLFLSIEALLVTLILRWRLDRLGNGLHLPSRRRAAAGPDDSGPELLGLDPELPPAALETPVVEGP